MNYQSEYERWAAFGDLFEEERAELLSIKENDDLKKMRFSAPLDFGTAGLRSTMYMGIGCMNRFTVAQTTRALAALVKNSGGAERGVVIAYDSRNNSEIFARVSASILAAAGVKVYIFDGIRPTPELSFALRELSCMAGINITASHNPKEYNGYKAYWEDGAQISVEQAKIVSEKRADFDVLDVSGMDEFDAAVADGRITLLDERFDEKYLNAVLATAISPELVAALADELKVVYTPLHGAGYKLVPAVFEKMGLKQLYVVSEQMIPDGNFLTVKKPNPEYAEVFTLGIELANKVSSDLIIATDPDSDRVGVMARGNDGGFVTLTGNQMGALLLDYVITERRRKGMLSSNAYAVKSIVSTDMAYKICEEQNVTLHDVLTGFKFIGEVIKKYEKEGDAESFVLGFEESYGYLLGTYARDKDAVEASMLILEMTAYYKMKNMTLCDALAALYEKYGNYAEATVDIYMEGVDGVEKRRKVMSSLRVAPPVQIGGYKVKSVGDYLVSQIKDIETGKAQAIDQPSSDVLYYTLENGDKIIVRPSGTEPKIKIYALAHDASALRLAQKVKIYKESVKELTNV
ncbi:MAG: phospho-sugar mutase [Clostridia bacterium]|nr:phospho-sugar mutase [Clostridia bacterium]